VFGRILHELVTSTDGAIGAVFVDATGEAVELVSERPFEADDHDLKVLGAYQGICLMNLRDLCTKLAIGQPQRFKVEFARAKALCCDLRDGYYIVLLVDGQGHEGQAWHQLDVCRGRLIEEMG
jgi:hypothetical protein